MAADMAFVTASLHQERNLKRMINILANNPEAMALAERIWRFFGCRLLCSQPTEVETSRIRYGITAYAPEVAANSIMPSIRLARSERLAEALSHELLHLELLQWGYPRFYFDSMTREQAGLARGIQNSADHVAMLPRFLQLGYAVDRFLTPRELTEKDARRLQEIEAMPGLHTPDGYTESVSSYLQREGFTFQLVYVR